MKGLSPAGRILGRADFVQTVILTTSAQAFDTPAGGRFVSFGASANWAFTAGSTGAAWPSATSTVGSTGGTSAAASELNPTSRDFQSTTYTTGWSGAAQVAGTVLSLTWYGNGG